MQPDGVDRPGLDARHGGLESVERVSLSQALVDPTPDGARMLGERYWSEVERTTRRLVRVRHVHGEIRLALLGAVSLLRFGPAEFLVVDEDVACAYPIRGGFLVARAGGTLSVVQRGGAEPLLEVAVTGYHARLAGSGRLSARRVIYTIVQAPLHRLVSRRFLERAAGGSR